MSDNPRVYRTFLRTCVNWTQFSKARKRTVERRLTLDEARRCCAAFNDNRTAAQMRRGTKLEFDTN